MKHVIQQVRQTLLERGHLILEENEPARTVSARAYSSVMMASLTFERGRRKVVVKPIAPTAYMTSAKDLFRAHERIRREDELLARMLPRFYEYDADNSLIFMEFIAGATLQDQLTSWLAGFRRDSNRHSLREAARGLNRLHRLQAGAMGVPGEPRLNASYLEEFESNWRDPLIQSYVTESFRDPKRFYRYLSAGFMDRAGQSVVMSDAQLKNILVRDGGVHFIDIDYSCGHPAIELAQFLCSFDRLRLRRPLTISESQLFALKQVFLDAYFPEAGSVVAQDLVFFYPYVLLRTYREHLNSRPWFMSYLGGFYGRRLRGYLNNLERSRVPWNSHISIRARPRGTGTARPGSLNGSHAKLGGPSAGDAARARKPIEVALAIDSAGPCRSQQPVTFGIPLPTGAVADTDTLVLLEEDGRQAALQTETLARWPDGSVKWLLVDSVLGPREGDRGSWMLRPRMDDQSPGPTERLEVTETERTIEIDTGPATFHVDRVNGIFFTKVVVDGKDLVEPESVRVVLTDAHREKRLPRVSCVTVEARGPVRATVNFEGSWEGELPCRFAAQCCFFAGTGLVRIRLTVHNPQRARHRGGMWDLGDPGSIFFKGLALELTLAGPEEQRLTWRAEAAQPCQESVEGDLEIYQDSSGGENWQSTNHVNREGRVPCSFRGYRVRQGGTESFGLRAEPTVVLEHVAGKVTAGIAEFWQQFPKAIAVRGRDIRLGLFPEEWNDLFELQGGEQKTHTVWLDFTSAAARPGLSLDWLHRPARVYARPEWYVASEAIPYLTPDGDRGEGRLGPYLAEAVGGPNSLIARREVIDEYGWRNYGEVYADHEAAYHTAAAPLITHYNNQYDVIQGAALQYVRTGDSRWLEVIEPMARHVADIDIYHTDADRAAYNGGLFWFTDHFKDAATCTHRTYSRRNKAAPEHAYGGGPSSNHNFTTGLLYYYFLTGDRNVREAAISLAEWVINMDEGASTPLGLIDPGATGAASATGDREYHGPGRGCGNSINALLDAWILTNRPSYLDKAEELVRRSAHPADDIAARDLLNVEKRWSYTVFFMALAKYLQLKAEIGELDFMYGYAQASLLHYAEWMLENEEPYFDHPEKLEYPTEAWAGQEFRKANVLRVAAAHATEPLRSRLLKRGEELGDRAWTDLMRFDSRHVARAIALVMVEGTTDAYFRAVPLTPAPQAPKGYDFGKPAGFLPQKARILAQVKTVGGLARVFLRLANPRNWSRVLAQKKAQSSSVSHG